MGIECLRQGRSHLSELLCFVHMRTGALTAGAPGQNKERVALRQAQGKPAHPGAA